MNKGFTLIELLVVVAIMGMLGVAATNGYSSLVRGMNERSSVATASGLLRAAKERAQVDRVPTAVFCYNKLVKAPTSTENGVVVGVMTAVRRAGRLTYVQGDDLYDEFADLNNTYEVEDDESELRRGGGWRLFKFAGINMSKMEYSIVSDRVLLNKKEMITVFSGSTMGGKTNAFLSAFFNLKKSNHEPAWKAGDAYAFEFSELQLPNGMIFGSEIPSDPSQPSQATVLTFDPESDNNRTVDIYATKPDASGYPKRQHRVGEATSDGQKAI